jgi:hypothetical protein
MLNTPFFPLENHAAYEIMLGVGGGGVVQLDRLHITV